ncbi:hypothetical protein F4808DRAFT_117310 [Astrocystis sublimbata]|nr:hypothetical protein F4808DRAFT_117310 [Astrocystis sublimbata]
MASHYPLNDVDLDFKRYAHRPLGGRDILISRLMEDLLNPRRVSPKTYLTVDRRPNRFWRIKSQDRELGLDMEVMCRLLEMEWLVIKRHPGIGTPFLGRLWGTPRGGLWVAEYTGKPISIQQAIIDLVQEHYFECDPLIHQAIKTFGGRDRDPMSAPGWKDDMIEHLALFQKALQSRHRRSLFSGNSQLSCIDGPQNGKLSLGSCFVAVPWAAEPTMKRLSLVTSVLESNLHRRVPKRSQSLPNLNCWGVEMSSARYSRQEKMQVPYFAFFPHKPLAELDKLSRRRSLSRSHIRAMFKDKPEWIIEDSNSPRPPFRHKHPCNNCAQYTHKMKDCPSRCGYCNSGEHKARSCTLLASNRCKCQPFPQFHRASKCHVPCSRRCGSPYPPEDYKHKNAILCTYRCCMCGIKGHSGAQCSLKKCPCGEQHLTQDCRWKVECNAKGCNYYLCALHCRECGTKSGKGPENAFVGRTCQDCLKNGSPASARASMLNLEFPLTIP